MKLTYDWPRSRPDPETFCLYCHQLNVAHDRGYSNTKEREEGTSRREVEKAQQGGKRRIDRREREREKRNIEVMLRSVINIAIGEHSHHL